MSPDNQTPAADDAAEVVIDEGHTDLAPAETTADFSDLTELREQMIAAQEAKEKAELPPPPLQTNPNGSLLSNVHNATLALTRQSALCLCYDEFLGKTLVQWRDDNKPRPMTDEDVTRTQIELQRMGMKSISSTATCDAMKLVSRENTRNCVADWLNGLEWDKTKRLSLLMQSGFGTPAERYYVRAGRNMLIAMVARALYPGCQVDEAIVLEGPQGSLKSSALRIIGAEFFAELTAHPNTKDFEQQLAGVWLGEFAELNALRRTEDISRLKQFITNRIDHLRLPYARAPVDLPRRVVLCGSTNESEWLHDPTGGRRFIPVEVGRINLEWLKSNREQLFAEAVHLYKAGRNWHRYPKEETLALQEARTPDDPWTPRVRDYLYGRAEVVDLSEVMTWVLSIPTERQTKANSTRLGVTLRKLGCVQQSRRRVDGVLRRPWIVPEAFASRPLKWQSPFAPPVLPSLNLDLTGGLV